MQAGESIEEYINPGDFDEGSKKSCKAKFKGFLESRYFVVAIIILVALISFFLGRISSLQEKREPVKILNNSLTSVSTNSLNTASVFPSQNENSNSSSEQVVASKNGTKYHYAWCAGAKQISEQNKIIFNSIEEARANGYTPAANCKGLK